MPEEEIPWQERSLENPFLDPWVRRRRTGRVGISQADSVGCTAAHEGAELGSFIDADMVQLRGRSIADAASLAYL